MHCFPAILVFAMFPEASLFAPTRACSAPRPATLSLAQVAQAGDAVRADFLKQRSELNETLTKWQTASSKLSGPSDSEKRWEYHRHKSRYSGHALAVVLEFRGPVKAASLLRHYRWKLFEQREGRVRLAAEPRDTVERLFCGEFQLLLDTKTHLPTSIRFADRTGR